MYLDIWDFMLCLNQSHHMRANDIQDMFFLLEIFNKIHETGIQKLLGVVYSFVNYKQMQMEFVD